MINDLEAELDVNRKQIEQLSSNIEEQNSKIIEMEENVYEMENL